MIDYDSWICSGCGGPDDPLDDEDEPTVFDDDEEVRPGDLDGYGDFSSDDMSGFDSDGDDSFCDLSHREWNDAQDYDRR